MPQSRLTRDEKNVQTEARILAAARAVFAERGYDGASMDAVAEHAGLSKGALYYRHSTKEDLFRALLEDEGRARAAALAELAAESAALATLAAESDAAAAGAGVRAQRAVDQLVEVLSPDSGWAAALPEFVAHSTRSPDFGASVADHSRSAREQIVALMDSRARDMGLEFPMEPEQIAAVISALATGIAIEHRIDPEAIPPELLGASLSLLLSGLAVAARRPGH